MWMIEVIPSERVRMSFERAGSEKSYKDQHVERGEMGFSIPLHIFTKMYMRI